MERLSKRVAVSDPENWYQQDSVTIHLYVSAPFRHKVQVKISVLSIDDFAAAYYQEIDEKYQLSIKSMYDHMKHWIYDRIPDKISLDWLYEHGFVPDC